MMNYKKNRIKFRELDRRNSLLILIKKKKYYNYCKYEVIGFDKIYISRGSKVTPILIDLPENCFIRPPRKEEDEILSIYCKDKYLKKKKTYLVMLKKDFRDFETQICTVTTSDTDDFDFHRESVEYRMLISHTNNYEPLIESSLETIATNVLISITPSLSHNIEPIPHYKLYPMLLPSLYEGIYPIIRTTLPTLKEQIITIMKHLDPFNRNEILPNLDQLESNCKILKTTVAKIESTNDKMSSIIRRTRIEN